MPGLYAQEGNGVLDTLLRINGGITSQTIKEATDNLTMTLKHAFMSFAASGYATDAEIEIAWQNALQPQRRIWKPPSSSQSAQIQLPPRRGAPSNYNMKCYSKTSIPSDFATRQTWDGRDCAFEMLIWVNNEQADFHHYGIPNTNIDLGQSGISKDCFEYDEADLISYGGPSGLKSVFQFIQDRFFGGGDTGIAVRDSLLARGEMA